MTKGRPLKKPKRNAVVFGRMLWGIIDFINAFLNGEIVNGTSNEIIVGDRKIIFKIKASTVDGGGGVYRGEYEPSGATEFNPGDFAFGDIVRVTPTNPDSTTLGGSVIPGVYMCVQDAPGLTDIPNHPLSTGGETDFWQWVSTYPSARIDCDIDGTQKNVFVDEQDKP